MVVASRTGRSNRLRILVRGVLLWLLGLAVGGYLVLTTAWFFILEKRTTNYVTWMDCILAPARWDEIRRKRGDAYVAEGLIALEQRKWSEAIIKIKSGLARSPENWTGRRNLGVFYFAAGQREQGLNLLIQGFDNRYLGREAMQLVLSSALLGEDFEKALQLVDSCLAQSGTVVDRDREWLVDQKCRVLMIAERHEEALAWVEEQSDMSEVRHESKVVALIELGRFPEARSALKSWEQGSGTLGGARRLAVRLAREEGDVTAMREALEEMREMAPLDPQPRVYAIIQEYLAGEENVALDALSGYLMRFGSKAADYELAADPLRQIEAWPLFDKLLEHARERGIGSDSLTRIRLGADVVRGEYEEAQTTMVEIRQANTDADPTHLHWLDMTEHWVAHLRSGDDATRDQLIAFLRNASFAIPVLKEVATSLAEADREVAALAVWEILSRRFPGSGEVERNVDRLRHVVGTRAEEEIEIPLVQDGVELDLDMVLPVAEELDSEVALALKSARRFERLSTRIIDEENWSELSDLIRELKRANPVWMSTQREMISRAELELHIVGRNWPALISILRFKLDGSVDNALDVMKLVRRLDDLGERRGAELVLAEVDRRHPNFPPVRRTRADWEPDVIAEEVSDSIEVEDDPEETLLPVR